MKNIDKELIDWAVEKIKKDYKEDVALLIGQKGACKLPTDEQNIAFDFYVPCTDRGYQLAETFIIEDMGYDLFPMSWERLEGIADLQEVITFAFANGIILYARSKEDEKRFLELQQKLRERLNDRDYCKRKTLEQMEVAMDIYKNLTFDNDMSHIRKAAGGVMQYLSISLATFNGTYLDGSYGRGLCLDQVKGLQRKPDLFVKVCDEIIKSMNGDEIKVKVHGLIQIVREYIKNEMTVESMENLSPNSINYEELAGWYYEMRYSLRKLNYFCEKKDYQKAYEIGCYIQIELDALNDGELGLEQLDLMGDFDANNLRHLSCKAKELEAYILDILYKNLGELKIYNDLEAFLKARS